MSTVTAADWIKGISLSILASIIGGASKLAIRKSWLMQKEHNQRIRSGGGTTPGTVNVPVVVTDSSYHAIQEEERSGSPYLVDGGGGQQNDESEFGFGSRHSAGAAAISTSSLHNNEDSSPSFEDEEESPTAVVQPDTVRMIAWLLRGSGMIGMTFLNPACSVLAMNYASPSILAPFSGLTLVWIVLFSQPLIHEKPTARQILAASLIILGEVLVAIFGDHTNEEDMTIHKMTESYKEGPFLAYIVGTALWVVLLMCWIKYSTNPTLVRFAWGVAGGSITGYQNFLKDTLTLIRRKGKDETLPWYTSFLAVLAVATAFTGLLFLTACMKRYDATYSAAMFVGSFVVNASIMAAVHYDTFAHLQGLVNWILYPGGLLVLMSGVWILIHEKGAQLEDDEDEDGAARSPRSDADSMVSGSTTSTAAARVELQEPLVNQVA